MVCVRREPLWCELGFRWWRWTAVPVVSGEFLMVLWLLRRASSTLRWLGADWALWCSSCRRRSFHGRRWKCSASLCSCRNTRAGSASPRWCATLRRQVHLLPPALSSPLFLVWCVGHKVIPRLIVLPICSRPSCAYFGAWLIATSCDVVT